MPLRYLSVLAPAQHERLLWQTEFAQNISEPPHRCGVFNQAEDPPSGASARDWE